MAEILQHCRACSGVLSEPVLDLGKQPAANALLTHADEATVFYPLRLRLCLACSLLQTDCALPAGTLFADDYPYFSSVSPGFVRHAGAFVADAVQRYGLNEQSFVLEVASNDGYLLQHCVQAGIPCLGVEATESAAARALAIGVPTHQAFFGRQYAEKLLSKFPPADLVVANNVLAHVPDPDDFVAGLATVLHPQGVLSIELQAVLPLLRDAGFDTVYHEHYSYWSLHALTQLLARRNLRLFAVERLSVHTGSLRLSICLEPAAYKTDESVAQQQRLEAECEALYPTFNARAQSCIAGFSQALHERKAGGVVGYGAAAKATVVLNACALTADDIPYMIDRNLYKQGKFIPGCGIPIVGPEHFARHPGAGVVIFPRNLREEVMQDFPRTDSAPEFFMTVIPEVAVYRC